MLNNYLNGITSCFESMNFQGKYSEEKEEEEKSSSKFSPSSSISNSFSSTSSSSLSSSSFSFSSSSTASTSHSPSIWSKSSDISASIFSFLLVQEVASMESISHNFKASIENYWKIKNFRSDDIDWRMPENLNNTIQSKKLRFTLTLIFNRFVPLFGLFPKNIEAFCTINLVKLSEDATVFKLFPKNCEAFWTQHRVIIEQYPPLKYFFGQLFKSNLNEDQFKTLRYSMSDEEVEREERLMKESNSSSDAMLLAFLEAAELFLNESRQLISKWIDQAIETGTPSAGYLLWQANNYIFDLEGFGEKAVAAMKKGHSKLLLSYLKRIERGPSFEFENCFSKVFLESGIDIKEIPTEILEYISIETYRSLSHEKNKKLTKIFIDELIERWRKHFKLHNLGLLHKFGSFYVGSSKSTNEVKLICKNFLNTGNVSNSNDLLSALMLLEFLGEQKDVRLIFNKISEEFLHFKEFVVYKTIEFQKNQQLNVYTIALSLVHQLPREAIPTSMLLERAYSLFSDMPNGKLTCNEILLNQESLKTKEVAEIFSYLLTHREKDILKDDKIFEEFIISFSNLKYELHEYDEVIRLFNLYLTKKSKENSNHFSERKVQGIINFIISNLKRDQKEVAKTFIDELLSKMDDPHLKENFKKHHIVMMIQILLEDFNQVDKADELLAKISYEDMFECLQIFWTRFEFVHIEFIYDVLLPKFHKTLDDLSTFSLYALGSAKLKLNRGQSSNLEGINLIELALRKLHLDDSLNNYFFLPEFPLEAMVKAYLFSIKNKNAQSIRCINNKFKCNLSKLNYPPEFLINVAFLVNRKLKEFGVADLCVREGIKEAKRTGQLKNINQKMLILWAEMILEKMDLDEYWGADQMLNEFLDGIGRINVIDELLECSTRIKLAMNRKEEHSDEEVEEEVEEEEIEEEIEEEVEEQVSD